MKSADEDLEDYIARLPPNEGFTQGFHAWGRNYRWFALLTIVAGNVAAMLAGTIINVAIPDIMGAFGISQADAQWLSTENLAAATRMYIAEKGRDTVTDWLTLWLHPDMLTAVVSVLATSRLIPSTSGRLAQAPGPIPSSIGLPVGCSGAPSQLPIGVAARSVWNGSGVGTRRVRPSRIRNVLGAGIGGQPCTVTRSDRSDSSG